jgi:hypothetical protein
LLIFFFLVGLGFEPRTSCLQSWHSTATATPPVHFSSYFGVGVLQTLCWGCSRTSVLPISTSQVARITGLKHWCWPRWVIFFFFWQYQSLNSGPQCLLGRHYHLSHSALPFCVWYFQDRVS